MSISKGIVHIYNQVFHPSVLRHLLLKLLLFPIASIQKATQKNGKRKRNTFEGRLNDRNFTWTNFYYECEMIRWKVRHVDTGTVQQCSQCFENIHILLLRKMRFSFNIIMPGHLNPVLVCFSPLQNMAVNLLTSVNYLYTRHSMLWPLKAHYLRQEIL